MALLASVSPGGARLPLASLGGCPRWACGSDAASFQTAASPLGLGVCDVLHMLCKSGVFISHSPPALPNVSLTGFQSQVFWGLISPVQDPWAEEPDMGWILCSLGRSSWIVLFLPSVGRWPWGCHSWLCYVSAPPASLVVLYVVSCEKSFLLVLRLFS